MVVGVQVLTEKRCQTGCGIHHRLLGFLGALPRRIGRILGAFPRHSKPRRL